MKNEDLIEENRDMLETVANSDLPVSWIGEDLLSVIEEEERQEAEKAEEPELKGSLLAY
ncbi:hypothetical protein [Natronomonas moolapensis]|uniref:hypothetical protein n=1 Tax=Natronomonas moolapensis TaxID=416273 RepID=UPI0013620046|nr:hypothetical protein [Natronomonas moolapensis]